MQNRELFRMVSQAAFSNPFGEGRAELDFRIARAPAGTSHADAVDMVVARVAAHVGRLEAAGKAELRHYAGEDRDLVRTAFLFDVFHSFIDAFDAFILRQVEAGEAACPVPFAGDVISILGRRGFTAEEAGRYIAIFYQLRRAFYFINNGLVGKSRSMRVLRMHLWNAVFTHDVRLYDSYLWDRMEEFSTLLLGQTGTGKGSAAAAIGRSGFIPFDAKKDCFAESFMRNFIPINLSQFPETLIESELFGHRKGAFTGAIENHEGVFSRCTPHGSIFLDEVGDVPVPVQIKLLQVLQERTFSPVGSHDKLRFHGRVVAATNRPLDELRLKGQFRDDFFYRISSDIITVPPLRQRIAEDPDELVELVRLLLRRMTGEDSEELAGLVLEVLDRDLPAEYPWPGNVRELEQAVRRVLVIRRYRGDAGVSPQDEAAMLTADILSGSIDAQTLLARYCAYLYGRFGTYEEAARRANMDRRTVKRYIELLRPPD